MINRPQCYDCKHYKGNFKCDAFDKSIPDDILFNKHDHTKPYVGDKGIHFDNKKDDKKSIKDSND